MRSYLTCLFAAVLPLLLLCALVVMATNTYSPLLVQSAGESATVWGGEHIEMEVTKEGATLEFDCAAGTITVPLAVDAQGKFRVSGTFTGERPGPTMRDGNPAVSATYSGSIIGDTMHLTIVAGPDKQSMGAYVLVRGKPGRVMKCR
jgi:hypothetical protein